MTRTASRTQRQRWRDNWPRIKGGKYKRPKRRFVDHLEHIEVKHVTGEIYLGRFSNVDTMKGTRGLAV